MNKKNKPQNKQKDTISNIKKEEEKKKAEVAPQNDEDYQADSDGEENTKASGVVQEQVIDKSTHKRGLRDIFGDKPNQPQPKPKKEKKQERATGDEPVPLKFTNSKGTANANAIDASSKSHTFESQQPKKQYTNTKALFDNTIKENEKIKPTVNYMEKEVQKKYKDERDENVPKPEFKNLKVGDQENFIEIKKNEDLFLKNLTNKPLENKLDYSDPKNPHPKKEKTKYRKEENEPKVELDSDGFEIVGSKPEKKSTGQKQNYNKPYNHNKKKHYKKRDDKKENQPVKETQKKGEGEENANKDENDNTEAKPEQVVKPQPVDGVTISMKAGAKLKDLFK